MSFPPKNALAATLGTLLATSLTSTQILAQAGDARDQAGHVQEELWKEVDVPPAPILTPEQALETFYVEPGYSIELVAAEPLVNDPVAIAWDEHGRLWAAEMWAYMPDADGTGEHEPVSRVVILEDDDGDGQMDRSTVFLDGLVLPRAISFVKGGALIADPPNLYFCQDTDGDLVADQKTIVAPYGVEGNVEHAENGLMRGIDNWLYNAKSSRRFKFIDGSIQEEETNFRGQWGIAQDDYGRLFYNSNSFYLYGDMVPWQPLNNHPGHPPRAGISHHVVPDGDVYTARVNTGVNRAYREGTLRQDYRLRSVTAVSAPTIARGQRYPDSAQGGSFIPEPAGNVVSRFELHDEGLEVSANKALHEHPTWGPIEFMSSTDERFRPVATAVGPDGFVYVVDMYRGILQHKTYLTTFLRKQIIERGLDQPVGLGRIYRIVHESDDSTKTGPKLAGLAAPQLIPYLAHKNGWVRDTAQRLIVESQDSSPATIKKLTKMTTLGSELARIHALWTLEGLGQVDLDIIARAFQKGNEWVRAHTLRIAEPLLSKARQSQHPYWELYQSALTDWPLRVRLQAVTLLPAVDDPEFAVRTISQLSSTDFDNPYFIDATVSTLHRHETELLTKAAQSDNPQKYSPLVTALAKAIFEEKNAASALEFVELAQEPQTPASITSAINKGWGESLNRKNVRPLELDGPPSLIPDPDSLVFKAFSWPGKVDPNAIVDYEYSEADLDSISRGKPLYQNNCAICHNQNGQGTPSLAPALAGSDWVKGSKERLALVVGQGLMGPIEVNGELWNQAMPPHGQHPALTGESFNDLLNYLRSSWGNNSSPFETGEARSYLQKHSDRNEPWIAEELEDLGLVGE
ncbi:c-type cytochrome [Pelagicoccus sp. SDUM812002]|uniref:DUF7133 domain-containing protein n=1 Tax=Pelagicoccus sp. SDUM812002 TaxID=3041266 RepID=UPI00280C987C|nr:c-type cytochrome [Pelagicoccus sp. SDUM812002]MDQ8188318.1 c-type cytochrome [Pelagicoccus sp. SDUM812002]